MIVDCERNGPVLKFKNRNKFLHTEILYDLRDNSFTKIRRYKTVPDKITTITPEEARYYFVGATLHCDDEKFDKVIKLCQHSKQTKYSNLARFIGILGSDIAKEYEEWLSLPITIIDFEEWYEENKNKTGYIPRAPIIHKTPSKLKKVALNKIKEHDTISIDKINKIIRYYNIEHLDILKKLEKKSKEPKYSDIFYFNRYNWSEPENMLSSGSYKRSLLLETIATYNLDIDAFCEFLHRMYHREAIDIYKLLDHYPDYLSMSSVLQYGKLPKVNKYPDNFLTTNYKIIREYDAKKEEYDALRFKQASFDKHENLSKWINKKYCIIVPQHPDEIEHEANEMKHCVRTYIKPVTEGRTLIVFLREKDKPKDPLVTVEVKQNTITQAYAKNDKKPSLEELEALSKWANQKHINIDWCWKEFK